MAKHWLTVIGGGLAGLSLCDEVLQTFAAAGKPLPGKILLLEQRSHFSNDKTYGFFDRHPPARIASQQYPAWCFSCLPPGAMKQSAMNKKPTEASQIEQVGTHYSYYRISALDAINDLLQRLQSDANMEIALGVDANSVAINSALTVDTRPCAPSDMRIKQSFVGVEVELAQPINPSVARLMTNMRMVNGRFTFDYILPLAANRALVEVTQFAREPASLIEIKELLNECLQQLGVSSAPSRSEGAILPMGLKRTFSDRLASQQIRTATGYGYLETKRWAQRNARAIFAGKPPLYDEQTPLLKWFDARLLKVIEQQPEKLPEIFMSMASHLSADAFAQFISTPAPLNLLKVMAAVPKRTFLRTLYA